ncbi:MAG: hypothetical protein KDC38_04860, partial [Planctomycetes bacterium]|nr:hypothetical protein [Planctomycetota bacterium]
APPNRPFVPPRSEMLLFGEGTSPMPIPDWRVLLEGFGELPTLEFVVRCARRVQPLFLTAWPDAPQRLYQLLDGAIETVEEITTGKERTTSTFAFNAMSAVKAASKAGVPQAACVASTVACATYALTAVGYGDLSITHAAQAAEYAVESFGYGNNSDQRAAQRSLIAAMESDIAQLREWTNAGHRDGPLPPGTLGPLWPDEEPEYVVRIPFH